MPQTLRQWEDSLRQPALCELLPVRDYLDGCIIRTNGCFVAGYEASGMNQENGCGVGQDVPLVGLERSHLNLQRNHCRLWVLDPHQGSQVVEAPCSPDVKVFQDGGILNLNLLDVVVEVQRD